MTHPRLLVLPCIAATLLIACGNTRLQTISNDAGERDVGLPDAGKVDAGVPDAGPIDAGPVDGGMPDAGDLDAGVPDAGCMPLRVAFFGNPGRNPSTDIQQWLTMSGMNVQRVQTTPNEPVTAELLQTFDVIVLDWLTRDYSASEASLLGDWVTAGGGLISMSGFNNNVTDDWHANSLLVPLSVAYSGSLLNGPVMDFAMHPVTNGLTSVTFYGGYAVSALGGGGSTRAPIAFLSPNSSSVPVADAIELGSGHAFVWGDEWVEFDDQWSAVPDIQRLWLQAFEWIAPADRCPLLLPE